MKNIDENKYLGRTEQNIKLSSHTF